MIAIVGGRIYPVDQPVIEEGTVVIEGDRIVSVTKGRHVPAGAEVVDATGKIVFPGMIDAHTHIGLFEDGVGWEGADGNEMTDPVTPEARALDGIYPHDLAFADARAAGITSCWVTPGSGNIIGGQGSTIHTAGDTIDEMLMVANSGMKCAFGENPKRVYGRDKKVSPMTRMGNAMVFRRAMVEAQNYLRKIETEKSVDRNLKNEALSRVLSGEIPLRAHSHRADDILTAVRLAEEFGLSLIIEHGTEAHKIASLLAERSIPVSMGPSLVSRVKVEVKDRTFETPGILANAGVKVALITDHPVVPLQYLPISAGLAMRSGMKEADAIAAVTQNPADLNGVGHLVGSLTPGKLADLAIWDGFPFDTSAKCLMTWIKGKMVYER